MDYLCIALKAQESQSQAQCMIEYVQQMLLKVSRAVFELFYQIVFLKLECAISLFNPSHHTN